MKTGTIGPRAAAATWAGLSRSRKSWRNQTSVVMCRLYGGTTAWDQAAADLVVEKSGPRPGGNDAAGWLALDDDRARRGRRTGEHHGQQQNQAQQHQKHDLGPHLFDGQPHE